MSQKIKKITPNTLKNESGLTQLIMWGESIHQIWVKVSRPDKLIHQTEAANKNNGKPFEPFYCIYCISQRNVTCISNINIKEMPSFYHLKRKMKCHRLGDFFMFNNHCQSKTLQITGKLSQNTSSLQSLSTKPYQQTSNSLIIRISFVPETKMRKGNN